MHSIVSYKQWGAHAVAKRVEMFVENSSVYSKLQPSEIALEHILTQSDDSSSKKRQAI